MNPGQDRNRGAAIVPSRPAQHLLRGGSVLAALVISGLAGCAMDEEDAVRAQVTDWVALQDTSYFRSTGECTAALFGVGAVRIKSGVKTVQNVDRGLRLLRQDMTVAFDVADMSPADIHKELDHADHSVGLNMLASGLAARDCFPEDLEDAFATVLATPGVVFVFDPENNAVALLERSNMRIFYTRGEL